jgi:putative ABC transport system permease protein
LPDLVSKLRSLWRGVRRRDDVEADMTEEFRHHLALRTEELVRRGTPPDEAARLARLEFGHVDSHKEAARAARGLRFFDEIRFSTLDVRLALRMLMKYRGLSLVSVIGMSVAIAIGTITFGGLGSIMDPVLPLDEGDRVVSIRNWNVSAREPDARALHDFLLWKAELKSVRELGAFRGYGRTLILDGTPHLVWVAEMTASGFQLARIAPIQGRPLLEEDEREGASPVVVIAHEEWQRLFEGDPAILGRTIRLGNTAHTIVGVMPEGFRFPVQHRYWIPLRLNHAQHARGSGPSISIFGRLADGVSRDVAQTELTTIGLRIAAAFPETHKHIRPRITPYTYPFLGLDSPTIGLAIGSLVMVVSLLLIVVAVNVAILVYARTATRTGEIAVRSALGASRRRIVTQLFIEALALSAIAAAVGLSVASVALEAVQRLSAPVSGDELPFWLDFGLSLKLGAFAAGLAIACAVIIGVLPALKATGRRVQTGLQQLSSRGSRMQLGRTWTVLIVSQVAIAVAVLPLALFEASQSLKRASAKPGYPAEEILQSYLSIDGDEGSPNADAAARALDARFANRAAELMRRLEAEPAVSGVTFDSHLSGYPYARIEGERGDARWAFINRVDSDFFAVFGVPISAGRGLIDADKHPGSKRVIVNRVLAERLFGNTNVLGRRIRYASEGGAAETGKSRRGPWFEIVGVVSDFEVQGDLEEPHGRLYEPVAIDDVAAGTMLSIRVRGSSGLAFAQRFREVAAGVDPTLQLNGVRSAADGERQARRFLGLIALTIVATVLSVVLLSAAGIYAMTSFTVARQRREIGIRSALGADPRRLLRAIFARASAQLGAGVVVGLFLAALLQGPVAERGLILLPVVAALMVVVGLLAALGPARQGLAIQPTEALREE